jgi:hypothetical protein
MHKRILEVLLWCSFISVSGCLTFNEVEYPPEVIPDIPPGDRTTDAEWSPPTPE